MRKKFTAFLILTFILGLSPVNFAEAITQNQIDAEVQIVCPDNYGNWYSGSGTIIDSKGIILTNKHVVTDGYGSIIKTCAVGFIESINEEPNFGTSGNINLAEVKYYTTSNDMDAAILYLENPTNKIYPYINIWNSNSSSLQFGTKIEAIGFPGIGGSTITYTSGDFSGYGGISNGTENYIKTTVILEHGNSGGAAYDSNGQFIGIPTMVAPGKLNSIGYILSIDSIKEWLSSVLGSSYKNQVTENYATERQTVEIQQDITPPDIRKLKEGDGKYSSYFRYYGATDPNQKLNYGGLINTDYSSGSTYNYIKIYFDGEAYNQSGGILNLNDIDINKVVNTYYYISSNLSEVPKNLGTKVVLDYNNTTTPRGDYGLAVTDKIELPQDDVYYIGLRFEDSKGNISDSYIFTYSYELAFQNLTKISYYSDAEMANLIGEFEYNNFTGNPSKEVAMLCGTTLKTLYVKWEYKKHNDKYMARLFNKVVWSMERGGVDDTDYALVSTNSGKLSNLDKGVGENSRNFCYNGTCINDGQMNSFVLKPYTDEDSAYFTGTQNLVALIQYNPKFPFKMACGQQGEVYNAGLKIGKTKDYSELFDRLSGSILLQVEENGEAYYVYPNDKRRYYLGRPADAFNVMRQLGLGATHDFITGNTIFPDSVSGKILLDVEQNGEAYYIYPKDRKAYYLGRPADAFKIMRELGLGITNSDLNKIPSGSL